MRSLILLALFLCCCATEPARNPSEMQGAFQEYSDCVKAAATSLASGPEMPRDIALASQGSCMENFNKFQMATRAFYMSGVSRNGKLEASDRATAKSLSIKDQLTELAVSLVINERKKPAH